MPRGDRIAARGKLRRLGLPHAHRQARGAHAVRDVVLERGLVARRVVGVRSARVEGDEIRQQAGQVVAPARHLLGHPPLERRQCGASRHSPPAPRRRARPCARPRRPQPRERLLDAVEVRHVRHDVGDREAARRRSAPPSTPAAPPGRPSRSSCRGCPSRRAAPARAARPRPRPARSRRRRRRAGAQHVPGEADRRRHADRLEGVVDAARSERQDRGQRVVAGPHRRRVAPRASASASFASSRSTAMTAAGAGEPRRRDELQPDAAAADHADRLPHADAAPRCARRRRP